MLNQNLLQKINKSGFLENGKSPVVVLPLKIWKEIEEYLEDLEIESSSLLKKKIAKARKEKKLYSVPQIKKLLAI